MKKPCVTLGRVKAFCERAFPSDREKSDWSGMGATIWEQELIILLNQCFPDRKYQDIVTSGLLLRNSEWFFTASRLGLAGARRYTYKVLALIIKLVDTDKDETDVAPTVQKIADGEFPVRDSLLSQMRKLRVMAAARLMAEQLRIPYSQEVFGLEKWRLTGRNMEP